MSDLAINGPSPWAQSVAAMRRSGAYAGSALDSPQPVRYSHCCAGTNVLGIDLAILHVCGGLGAAPLFQAASEIDPWAVCFMLMSSWWPQLLRGDVCEEGVEDGFVLDRLTGTRVKIPAGRWKGALKNVFPQGAM